MELGALERLNERHDLSRFDAGPTDVEGQSAWLRERGVANDRRGFTRVFVATYAGTARVAGFFGLAPGAITRDTLPRRLRPHGTPRIIPVILLGRLAVDRPMQGKGVGRDLMLAALSRSLDAHEQCGGAYIVVDAVGEKARRLYTYHRFVVTEELREGTTRMMVQMEIVTDLLRIV